jgi:flagellar basal body-associated protein FliL
MAEESVKTQQKNESQAERQEVAGENQPPKTDSKIKFGNRLLNSKVVAVLVVSTLILNAAGFAYHSMGGKKTTDEAEHNLGTYHFLANTNEKGNVSAARFNLHIAILAGLEKEARRLLAEKKHRVQQNVEELLRKAHSGDFEDPCLGELKRRLQARINETLGMKAVGDVIVTDLKLQKSPFAAKPTDQANQSPSWIEH